MDETVFKGNYRLKLTKRLRAVADFVQPGARVIDVGTDHGYVPLWLLERGIASEAVACDIAPGPLSSAKRTAAEADITENISFVLTDGLRGLGPEDGDTVIIAGMGGETMMSILEAAPWTAACRLILQPQSKQPLLERWMDENGYTLSDATLVKDSGRIYTVRCYDREKYGNNALEIFRKKRDPLLGEYLDRLIKKYGKMVSGMERSDTGEELRAAKNALEEYTKMREELR